MLTFLVEFGQVLADIIPKETLLWKLKLIKHGAAYANARLHAVKAEVLVLARFFSIIFSILFTMFYSKILAVRVLCCLRESNFQTKYTRKQHPNILKDSRDFSFRFILLLLASIPTSDFFFFGNTFVKLQ